jgi:GntR family transcriptional regulator/MocR family aminotransferase
MGYQVRTVEARDTGMTRQDAERIQPDLIYMMPSHQFPLGSVMPMTQRLELLKWASEQEGRYLIEDDYDSEYRYRGKPIPSLQSIDSNGKVIYLGTFSKSVAPSLRISYMVLPPQLLEKYKTECGFYSTTVPRMQQEILREFIRDGHFGRHLNRMRGIYRSRHDYLLGELKKRFWVKKISGDHAGMHLLVQVNSKLPEEEICRRAAEQGIGLSGLLSYRLGDGLIDTAQNTPTLLLGYGKLTEQEIQAGLAVLDEIFEKTH